MLCVENVETAHVHNKPSMYFCKRTCTTGPGCLKILEGAGFTCLAFRTSNQEQPPAATPAAAKAWQAVQAHDLRNADVDDLNAAAKTGVLLASRTGAAELGHRRTDSSHVG